MTHPSEPDQFPLTFEGKVIGYGYAGNDGQLYAFVTDPEVAAQLSRTNTTTSISIQEPTK